MFAANFAYFPQERAPIEIFDNDRLLEGVSIHRGKHVRVFHVALGEFSDLLREFLAGDFPARLNEFGTADEPQQIIKEALMFGVTDHL
ncbi:hypothetical protein D3C77_413470 [compost metagenome]